MSPCSSWRLLPASAPRVAVPAGGSARAARTALALYRPGLGPGWLRKQGSLLRSSVTGRVAAGPCADYTLTPDLDRGARALREITGRHLDVVAWLGSPGHDRKLTLVGLDPATGRPEGYAKLGAADAPGADALVRAEADTLRMLAESPLAARVPVLWGTVEGPRLVMVTRPLAGRRLASMSALDADRCGFLGVLRETLGECPDGDRDTVWSHGDFTPWNCVRDRDGRLGVLDWEFLGRYPRGWDEIHHEVQRVSFFSRRPAGLAASAVLPRLRAVLGRHHPGEDPDAMIARYCARSVSLPRASSTSRARRVRQQLTALTTGEAA